MRTPTGFRFAGFHSGIKPNRKDVALVFTETPAAAAGVFTVNRARAAPIIEAASRVPAEGMHAVVVNSGNANALTGEAGLENVRLVKAAAGEALKVPADAILTASTGVIGAPLPVQKIVAAMPRLVSLLRAEPEQAAEAIMTTDTRIKVATRTVSIGGVDARISAICKGSGMIAPQLATTIAVIVTDCDIRAPLLQRALRDACDDSFNCLNIDGDMSTNDVVYALANGRARNRPIVEAGEDLTTFTASLTQLCRQLAREIAADGEGATKLLEVRVMGAPAALVGRDLARSIAGSPLVKAAMFGSDPNWGRVLATVGARAGSQNFAVDPYRATVRIQGITVYGAGPVSHDSAALRQKMRAPEVLVEVSLAELALGDASQTAVAWGCDLSYDYVKINADYTSLIVQSPDGGTAKDDRLTNYSPAFKVKLLVEALSYISRFSGNRCVVKYGGAAMVKDSLKKSFCDDIQLLRSAGLLPIVVHGGGPEIKKTLDRLGGKGEIVEGMRVTTTISDLKMVEMVLNGAVNTELVTLLNQEGSHAVGVSGKDGGLLRARRRAIEADGRDPGLVGEVTVVNKDFLEMLLKQRYVPVISPVGMDEEGQTLQLNGDQVAAEVAIAVGATKLIYLTDVAGILEKGELVDELKAAELAARLAGGSITGGMKVKARSVLRAVEGGVERVHVIDGRTPHSVIAELFTDRGVGTLITK